MKEITHLDFYNYVTSVLSMYITDKKHPVSEIIQVTQDADTPFAGQLWGTFYLSPVYERWGFCIVKSIREAVRKDMRDVWSVQDVMKHFSKKQMKSYHYNVFESEEEFDRYLLVEELSD